MPSAHLHLLISAQIKNPPGKNDCKKVEDFMRGMVKHVRMKILRDASALWCDEEGNEGITADVLLTTSHSMLHIWNESIDGTCRMEFDLYSCAPFSVEEVFEYVTAHFDVSHASYKFLNRETGFTVLNNGIHNSVSQ